MTDNMNQLPDDGYVSKSRIKQEMNELQDLGIALAELPTDTLAKIELTDDLRRAILEYKKITARSAKKRQSQYIGKIMRSVDAEPIRAFLSALNGESAEFNAWLHLVERWREKLLDSPDALSALLAEYPCEDVQQLRTLIRNAKKERDEQKPPKNYRQLFQVLKQMIPDPVKAQIAKA